MTSSSNWLRVVAVFLFAFGMIAAAPAFAAGPPVNAASRLAPGGMDAGQADQSQPMPTQPMDAMPAPVPNGAAAAQAFSATDYTLGVGDKLQLTVFGEDDLSGDFTVSSTGTISLPLIGEVPAAGQTVNQVHAAIAQKLSEGYMKNPKVSLQVAGYRPFFIVGEVLHPGSYNYVNGMRVINAVALAGGYSYRADKGDIHLQHASEAKMLHVQEDTPVQPGDVITITERYF